MTEIIVALIVGIVIGCADILSYNVKRVVDHVSKLALFVMLWCLAAKVGCDKELVAALGSLGWRSLSLAAGVIGGNFVVLAALNYFFRERVGELIKEETKK